MYQNKIAQRTSSGMLSEWMYRGEGNDSVVLSLEKLRKILRIKKTVRPKSIIAWVIVWISDLLLWYLGKGIEDEIRDIKFYTTVMRRLIGIKYTSEANQVILTKKQVKILENDLEKYRPDFRKHKILQYGRSTLYDDFAYLPEDEYTCLPFKLANDTFAIEIKPKQGWRALSHRNSPKCIYCMHQYLKLSNGKITKMSDYCPEDLFSGEKGRMNRALKSLIETPQHNFRIFKNGKFVYGDGSVENLQQTIKQFFNTKDDDYESLEEAFCDLIRKCLLTNMMNVDFTPNCEEKLFCEWNKIIQKSSSKDLPVGCVLEKILSIQMLDSEGSEYYNKLLNKQNLKDWDYIDLLLGKIQADTCLKCTVMMLSDIREKEENIEMKFIPYMISAIANDCSLMIAFKKIDEEVSDDLGTKNIMGTPYGHFVVNVGVVDLTPKPLSAIRRHYKRDKDVLQAYEKATKLK